MRVSTAFNRLLGIRGVSVSGVRFEREGWCCRCGDARGGWSLRAVVVSAARATTGANGGAGVISISARAAATWSASCAGSLALAASGW